MPSYTQHTNINTKLILPIKVEGGWSVVASLEALLVELVVVGEVMVDGGGLEVVVVVVVLVLMVS